MSENRTEQATPRRREKARQEGQVAYSRDLSSSLVFLAGLLLIAWLVPGWVTRWRALFQTALDVGVTSSFSPNSDLFALTFTTLGRIVGPVFLLTWTIAVASMAAQTGFRLAPAAMKPNFGRFNPVANLSGIFSSAGISRTLKSLVPLSVIVYLAVAMVNRDWADAIQLSGLTAKASITWVVQRIYEIGWKSGLVFLAWAGFDYFLQRRGLAQRLRMTKEEVRQENKDTGPNPLVRGRIRRLQRQMQRKWMLQDVSKASVVVTNPTHYAIALQYEPETMSAPVVIAKGRDLLAQQIKDMARWHNVPLVENVPLAHALYRSAEVGQAIPVKLYTAIAEILAFIYQAQARAEAAHRTAAAQQQTQG